MSKKRENPSKESLKEDLYVIRVGTAGIGGLSFRAYFDDERIDRSEGDDFEVFSTPGEALSAIGKKLDEILIRESWFWRNHPSNFGSTRNEKNKEEVVKGLKQRAARVKREVIEEMYEEPELKPPRRSR